MALYGGFDVTKHFDELDDPLVTQEGVLTPATRRARCLVNMGVDATAAELDILDGATLSTAELNLLDGVTSTTAELNILDGVTSTLAELNLLDGSSATAPTVSTAAILDSAGALRTAENVGTAGTNVTAVEYGDGYNHVTVLTLTAAALTPTVPADAEGAGAIIYTFPTGVYVGNSCHMDITAGTMDSATNAADLGVGSLISSGDIATLTTAAMEDWVTGQTVADVSTFVKEKSTIMTASAPLLFESAGSHVVHINAAAAWNATVATADVTGTVTLHWTFLGT